MKKYKCEVCGYIYDPQLGDPDNGIEPGTAFEDLPEDWVCPLCQGQTQSSGTFSQGVPGATPFMALECATV